RRPPVATLFPYTTLFRSVRVAVLVHELVHVRDLLEGEGLGEARVDLARRDQVVQGLRLLVVGEVRALKALLPHPEVAEIGDRGVDRKSTRLNSSHDQISY